ncbi:MAG: PfkB family carbohydrate kinase [Aquificaceae bacterium]|nr:PfkB family carbohydrate kinase [Aquificaceae bacterium]
MRVKALEALEAFKSLRVFVIGDVMLDRYIFGKVERISPEAPVPILEVISEDFRLGGAGNVALNLRKLGASVTLFGAIGNDEAGFKIKELLNQNQILSFITTDQRRTTQKLRAVSVSQQLLRLDYEDIMPLSDLALKELENALLNWEGDGIVISDYYKGVISDKVMALAKQRNLPIVVDPRPKNAHLYKGVSLMTPNEKEAKSIFNISDLENLGWKIKQELNLKALMITLGPNGIALFEKDFRLFPARARQVFDVSGAGDTVCAVASLCLFLNESLSLACELANLAAGIVVGKLGTYAISAQELELAIRQEL